MGSPFYPSLLESDLIYLSPHRPQTCWFVHCGLGAQQLWWQAGRQTWTLQFQDMLSVSPGTTHPSRFGFRIHACPLMRRWPVLPHRVRRLQTYQFICSSAAQQADWSQALQTAIQDHRQSPPLQHVLVIINPQSGQGQAADQWLQVQPLFQHSNIQVTVLQTTGPEQLHTCLNPLPLREYDGLVMIGGDGTVHGIINALNHHPDGQMATQLPLGVIPAGTGNGLCQSVLAQSGEPFDPISAAFVIVQGKPQPIDWIAVAQPEQQRVSILSCAWGLISDIDLGSEPLRGLGPLRTDVWALYQIAKRHIYTGQLQFQATADGPWHSIDDHWITLWVMNVPWATETVQAAPQSQLADGHMDLVWVRSDVSRWQLLRAFLRLSTGTHLQLAGIEAAKAHRIRFTPQETQGQVALDGEPIPMRPIELSVQQAQGRVFCLGT